MNEQRYKVHIIVDPDFADQLCSIPAGEPVWIVDSEKNHKTIKALWSKQEEADHTKGITSFTYDPAQTGEDLLIANMDAIDLHHGQFSHIPPYSIINVIGVSWSKPVEDTLRKYGFGKHRDTDQGFIAWSEIG